ncbi:MAG: YdeI/OmpD-associated family protein [Thermomicrobiales bacterium]|nr:YdeI/OmpD-associated family protein [Thermomicrobiales bacterium]
MVNFSMSHDEPGSSQETAVFFESREAFMAWLDEHHTDASALWVGRYKKGSGRVNISWPESVDAALCFGWIDGQGKSLGAEARAIRFSPRRRGSIWSAVNVRRFAELSELGLARPAGHAAYAARREDRTGVYSHEQAEMPEFDAEQLAAFQANPAAWEHFSARPPSCRKAAIWWVISAKKAETRARRLQTLIDDSAEGRMLAQMQRGKAATSGGTPNVGDLPDRARPADPG